MKITGFADEISQDLTTQVEGLKGLGINYVEMRGVDGDNLIYHSDEKVREIKRVLDENGIQLSALGTPIGKIGIKDDFEPHFEELKRAIEIGHKMDCKNIRMFSFYLPEGSKPEQYESAVFERMAKFVEYATQNDALLLHENEKGIYGEKATECKKLMDAFYGEHFKGIFDFANFVQCQEDTWAAYQLLKQYIAYIHVKDAKKEDGSVVPAGYGDGNVKKILDDLQESGYHGFLSLEPHLFDFDGFAALEKDGISMKNKSGTELSGLDAFTIAYNALIKLI